MNFQEYNPHDPDLKKFSGELLPIGEYLCTIADAKERQNNAGTGSMLAIEFAIIDGDFHGRTIYENLNLNNPNQTAVNIARARLGELLTAIECPGAQTPAEILGRDVVVKIKHGKDKATAEIRQQIGGYRNPTEPPKPAPAARGAAPRTAPPLPQQPAQAPTNTNAPAQPAAPRQPVRPGAAPAPWG